MSHQEKEHLPDSAAGIVIKANNRKIIKKVKKIVFQ